MFMYSYETDIRISVSFIKRKVLKYMIDAFVIQPEKINDNKELTTHLWIPKTIQEQKIVLGFLDFYNNVDEVEIESGDMSHFEKLLNNIYIQDQVLLNKNKYNNLIKATTKMKISNMEVARFILNFEEESNYCDNTKKGDLKCKYTIERLKKYV